MYKILNNDSINKFIKDNYTDVLNDIIERNYMNISISNNTRIISYGNKEKQAIHQRRILRNYILPSIYLIYSFIYIKYYNIQSQKIILYENKINYNMYLYFFSHENLIIKKSNIFLYKYFNKKNNNKLQNNKIDLSIKDEILTDNNKIVEFIDFIIMDIKRENNYEEQIKILDKIIKNLKEIIKNMDVIKKNYEDYKKSIDKQEFLIHNILSNIIEYFDKKILKKEIINELFDEIKKQKKFNLYGKHKLFFNKIFDIYNIILKNLNNINIEIINLVFYKKEHIELIKEENISIKLIKEKINIMDQDQQIIKANYTKTNIKYIIDIKNNLKEKINIYTDLFEQKNNNSKSYIESFLDELKIIINKDLNLFKNLKDEINKINKTKNNYNNIEYKNIFIDFFLNSFHVYQKFEYNYIQNIINKKINISELILDDIKLDNIKSNKINFNIKINKYVKKNNEKEKEKIIENLNSKKNDINNIISEINSFINSNTKLRNVPQNEIDTLTNENMMIEEEIKRIEDDMERTKQLKEKIDSKETYKEFIKYIKNNPLFKGDQITTVGTTGTGISTILVSSINSIQQTNEKNNLSNLKIEKLGPIFRDRFKQETTGYSKIVLINKELLKKIFVDSERDIYNDLKRKYVDQKNTTEFNNLFFFEQIKDIEDRIEYQKTDKEKSLKRKTKELEDLLSKKYNYEFNEFYKEKKNNYNDEQREKLNNIITIINTKIEDKKNETIDKIEFKNKYNEIFTIMYDGSNKIQNIIYKYNENKSKNKIKYYYDHDKNFNTILYNYNYNISNPNELYIYTNKLSTYFSKNEKYFITKILELKEKDETLKSLLDQYYEYYQELINKIKNILNKINIGRLLLNNNIINDFKNIIDKFNQIIKPKIIKKQNIINNSEKNKDNLNKRGEYTIILAYTDIMLLYFIDLLIIIDYLTYFYE